jgi:hypothetical protein
LCRFIPLIDGRPFYPSGTKGNNSERKLSPFVTADAAHSGYISS